MKKLIIFNILIFLFVFACGDSGTDNFEGKTESEITQILGEDPHDKMMKGWGGFKKSGKKLVLPGSEELSEE